MRKGLKHLFGGGASTELCKVRSERFPDSWWLPRTARLGEALPKAGPTRAPRPPSPQPGRFSCSLSGPSSATPLPEGAPPASGTSGAQGTASHAARHTPWEPRAGAAGGSRPGGLCRGSSRTLVIAAWRACAARRTC